MSIKLQPKQVVILGSCPKCMKTNTNVKEFETGRIKNIGRLKYKMVDLICNDCKYEWEIYGSLIMVD